MTTQPIAQTIQRVPHLRDGLIVDKVGIARTRDRLPLPSPECSGTSR
jgi:hypothetical protein